jgi:hypothetical protein
MLAGVLVQKKRLGSGLTVFSYSGNEFGPLSQIALSPFLIDLQELRFSNIKISST